MSVESAAPEFARLASVNKERTGIGFINKYNTFSILNELRWALDPAAVFPVESIGKVTETTWSDPHANPTLELVSLEETLKRRALLQTVTKRIVNCRAVIVTLGLAEVWRDIKADVYLNNTPIPPLREREPDRYELHLTSFAQNWQNLEAIHALLSRYGHPDLRIVVTVSPVPLHATFLKMDVVLATTYAKSLLRAAAQQWATAHENVDYFPSYEIVQNSDRAAVWESDRIHVTSAGYSTSLGCSCNPILKKILWNGRFLAKFTARGHRYSTVGVADLVTRRCRRHPDKPSTIHNGRRFSLQTFQRANRSPNFHQISCRLSRRPHHSKDFGQRFAR